MSAIITYMGAVVSALGALLIFFQENEYVGVPAVIVLVGAVITAGGALWSSGERSQFERELRDRSDEIAELNRRIAASVTGGDSFCYVVLASLGIADTNTAILTMVHHGEYPLYDVSFYIVDLQAEQGVQEVGLPKAIQVGNISPNSAGSITDWQLPSAEEQGYNIFISARNGFFTQLLRCKRVNGQWKVATRVEKQTAGNIGPANSSPGCRF